MIAYAESSAVLAWLLGESEEGSVRDALGKAERVVASTLTTLECARALARGAVAGRVSRADELAALKLLDDVSASWVVLAVTDRVLDRARERFPAEPVRTLDALHLATSLEFSEALGSITMVSLDSRVRDNAAALGLSIAPAGGISRP